MRWGELAMFWGELFAHPDRFSVDFTRSAAAENARSRFCQVGGNIRTPKLGKPAAIGVRTPPLAALSIEFSG